MDDDNEHVFDGIGFTVINEIYNISDCEEGQILH